MKIHTVKLSGTVDDDFAIDNTVFCNSFGGETFAGLDVTESILDRTRGTFTLKLYDHLQEGYSPNGVSFHGTAEYTWACTIKVDLDMNRLNNMPLLETNTLSVAITPTNITPSSVSIEIAKQGRSTWYTLSNGQQYQWIGRISGSFILRAAVDINGTICYSDEQSFEVTFPTFDQITIVPSVVTAMNAAWNSTVNFASQTQSREEGFYIFLNTETGVYEFDQTTYGPIASPTNIADGTDSATMSIPSPPMEVVPAPNGPGTTYTVAHIHTHTPTFFWPSPPPPQRYVRDVGPSTGDNQTYTSFGIPGIVYDYVEDSNAASNGFPGVILDGHPLNSTAQLYSSGPDVRPTD